jgi:hypothetical protein
MDSFAPETFSTCMDEPEFANPIADVQSDEILWGIEDIDEV